MDEVKKLFYSSSLCRFIISDAVIVTWLKEKLVIKVYSHQ